MNWEEYYTNQENIEKIAKFCRYREVIIIKRLPEKSMALRPFKIFAPAHLQYWIKRLNLTKIRFDLYISNASIRLPPLPSDLRKLKEARAIVNQKWRDFLNGEEPNFVTGFDVFADVDIEEENQRGKAREYALILAGELRKRKYDAQVWDTSRGFHVIVLGKFEPDFAFNLVREICEMKRIPTSIQNSKKPYVDLSVTGDIRRIRRCPFSLHSKTGKPMQLLQA